MKKSKQITNDQNTKLMQKKYKQISKEVNKIGNNTVDEYGFETYINMQKMAMNNPFEEVHLGSGEMEEQIQSYKEQLIDAKLKNIKLTNEVQKLKELSKTQMTKFYGGLNQEGEDIQNQTDSMFYKTNSGGMHNDISNNQQIKIIEEKYEKKISKYHEKIKALKEHNSKLEDLVLKLKDTLDRANEVFPNFLMQLSNNNSSSENKSINKNRENSQNENEKENPLMVSVGEDPIYALNASNDEINLKHMKIMEENRKLGAENLELKNALVQLEEEIVNIKSERNKLGNYFDNKLKLIQQEMENTNKKNEDILNSKIQEFNQDLIKKQKEIELLINENNQIKNENQQYILQVTTLTEEAQQRMEEIGVLEEQIKNNEYLLNEKNNKDNLIQELNEQIENYKNENSEIKIEQNNKIIEYENKIKILTEQNKGNINQINELKSEINDLNEKIKNSINNNDINYQKLKLEIDNKNKEINLLKNELQNKRKEIEKLDNDNKDKLDKINELLNNNDSTNSEIKNLTEEIKKFNRRNYEKK